jgi:hypothetical protein
MSTITINDINNFLLYLSTSNPSLKQQNWLLPRRTHNIKDIALNSVKRHGTFSWSPNGPREISMYISLGKDGIGFGFCGVLLDHNGTNRTGDRSS